jgi:hypothetical protein
LFVWFGHTVYKQIMARFILDIFHVMPDFWADIVMQNMSVHGSAKPTRIHTRAMNIGIGLISRLGACQAAERAQLRD